MAQEATPLHGLIYFALITVSSGFAFTHGYSLAQLSR
jgi:hypothetical protein